MTTVAFQGPATPPNFSVVVPACGDQLGVHQLRMIADVLRRGGVVWFMSDCGYALAVDPRHPVGVAALDLLLDHSGQPIPLTVADEALASRLIRFNETVRKLTGRFWPGGLGIKTEPASRAARRIAHRLHARDGVVIRMSQSIIERQISATAGMAITSAALRRDGQLIADAEEALDLALELHERSTPGHRTVFVRDLSSTPRLRAHSTMLSVVGGKVITLRHGSVDVYDAQKAALSYHGVDWSSAT